MKNLLAKINESYGIRVVSAEKVQKGFLSENYILSDKREKYFLKKYRFDSRERILEIHLAKKYFAEGGIPVILPLSLKHGETFFLSGGSYYALFPFIDERQIERGKLSETAIISLGEMLAHIHLLGKKSMLPIREKFKPWDKEKTLEKILLIEAEIHRKSVRDEFDKTALKNLSLKKRLVLENTLTYEDVGLPSDHLIHGDYLDTNVFFDENDRVSHVFDFEKTDYSPRAFELFRSMMYFLGKDITQITIAKAKIYFDAYTRVYPLTNSEIRKGLLIFYLKSIHGLWVESEHYLEHTNRVDEFLYSDSERVKYLSENLKALENLLTR